MAQIYCVIDCSGSMEPYVDRTISGFNEFIQSSNRGSEFSLILFNDVVDVVYENKMIENVKPLDNTTYIPRGWTALLDGVGKAVELAEKFESKSGADEKSVIVLIMPDGQENSSTKYTQPQITSLIAEKKRLGWDFIFMGANQDAIQTASEFSIDQRTSLTFDTNNVSDAFRSASSAIERSQRGDNIYFTPTERSASLNP